MVVRHHRKLSASTNRVRRRLASMVERRVMRLEMRLGRDEAGAGGKEQPTPGPKVGVDVELPARLPKCLVW